MFRLLTHRLNADDTTLNDLLAYGRSLMSTYETTADAQYQVHKADVDTFLTTIYFAYYMHQDVLRKLWIYTQVITISNMHPMLKQMSQQLFGILTTFLNITSDIIDRLDKNVEDMNILSNSTHTYHMIKDCFETLNYTLNQDESRTLIYYTQDLQKPKPNQLA